jgi:DNA-binding transcriptional LysR family regulator
MDVRDLELRHLRVLVALAEEGTFTDAAVRLGVSQPAASRTLARLEDLLGVELVERTTRSLRLTDAGRSFYDAAVTVLGAVDALAAAAQHRARPLRLGYTWGALGPYTQTVLQTWRRLHPEVPLEVHRIEDRSAGLSRGSVDVAIGRGVVTAPGFRVTALFKEGRAAAVAASSPLAHRASVDLADLAGEVIAIAPEAGTTTIDLWPPGQRPTRVVEVANIDEWLLAIASGQAVGVTAESTASQHGHEGVRFIPLPEADRITVSLVSVAARTHPHLVEFEAVVKDCINTPRP